MPWYFRRARVGPLVGKRTWGGLVGYDYPALLDGGRVTAPRVAFWNPEASGKSRTTAWRPTSKWNSIRSSGARARRPVGQAVEILLEDLEKNPPPRRQPAYPDYYKQ